MPGAVLHMPAHLTKCFPPDPRLERIWLMRCSCISMIAHSEGKHRVESLVHDRFIIGKREAGIKHRNGTTGTDKSHKTKYPVDRPATRSSSDLGHHAIETTKSASKVFGFNLKSLSLLCERRKVVEHQVCQTKGRSSKRRRHEVVSRSPQKSWLHGWHGP